MRTPTSGYEHDLVRDDESSPVSSVPEGCSSSGDLLSQMDTWIPGRQKVGRFELLEPLGAGAFGTVWRARDTLLDRLVAIKVPQSRSLSMSDIAGFLREARSAAQLRHPNIVRVHEVGQDGDTAYIVSDLVDGMSLAEWLADTRPAPREAAALCAKLAFALQHAHEQGIVHRDLKPGNVMLGRDGEPHLLDFGLAKREADDATMTRDGQILGTLAYMPPEQARGHGSRVDGRADVYSLGVILYEILTGQVPFRGSTPMVLHQVLREDAVSPRSIDRSVPEDLERICLKCLEKKAADRYRSARELAEDLQRFLAGKPVQARRLGLLRRGWRMARPRAVRFVPFAAAGLAIVLSVATVVQGYRRDARLTLRLAASEVLRDSLWIQQMTSTARSDHYRVAVAAAGQRQAAGPMTAKTSYDLACVYALASAAASKDAQIDGEQRRQDAEEYRAAALQLLVQSQRAGYFATPDAVQQLRDDPDFESLRDDPAFHDFAARFKEEGP